MTVWRKKRRRQSFGAVTSAPKRSSSMQTLALPHVQMPGNCDNFFFIKQNKFYYLGLNYYQTHVRLYLLYLVLTKTSFWDCIEIGTSSIKNILNQMVIQRRL